jgi:hypothetical protein
LQYLYANTCNPTVQRHAPYWRFYKKYAQKEKATRCVQRVAAIGGDYVRHACPVCARAKPDGDDEDKTDEVDEAFFER